MLQSHPTCPNSTTCNHKSHGSLRKVVGIIVRAAERMARENPEEYRRLMGEVNRRAEAEGELE